MATQQARRNERLSTAVARSGLTLDAVAERIGVDRKTVERWVAGRAPHPRHRWTLSRLLAEDHTYLWPEQNEGAANLGASNQELTGVYPQRAMVPLEMWKRLFQGPKARIELLAYAAVFLHEQQPNLNEILKQQASRGCRIRIAIGDPDAAAVRLRGEEEDFGHGIQSRCELALLHYQPLLDVPNISIHTHGTTLYNSIYRFDNEMLVNAHVWGANAYLAPVLHLRRLDGGSMFDTYARSFDAVWATSETVDAPAGLTS